MIAGSIQGESDDPSSYGQIAGPLEDCAEVLAKFQGIRQRRRVWASPELVLQGLGSLAVKLDDPTQQSPREGEPPRLQYWMLLSQSVLESYSQSLNALYDEVW